MTVPAHAAVWLDHHEARIFHVDLAGFDEAKLAAPAHHVHRHPKGSPQHQHPEDETKFFAAITSALATADDVLLLGPSTAKAQLVKYVETHARALAGKIKVEPSDHPTDAQLVAQIRKHFHISEPRVS